MRLLINAVRGATSRTHGSYGDIKTLANIDMRPVTHVQMVITQSHGFSLQHQAEQFFLARPTTNAGLH